MTKTTWTTTVTETTGPDGEAAWRIECTCPTHPAGKTAAVVADHGQPFPRANVHGTVLGAHHPARVIRVGLRRKGIMAVEA